MGLLTRNNYQFDASISVEDSNIYLDIVAEINGKLKSILGDTIQNLSIAQNIIDYDIDNHSKLSAKINEIDEMMNRCDLVADKITKGVQIYEEYDASLKEILDSYLIDGLFNGMKIHFKDDGTVEEMDLDNLFQYFDGNQNGDYYGCNQNPYGHIKKTDPEYYEYLRKIMEEKYGLSSNDIDLFMNIVDDSATCTYAKCVNEVIFAYKDRPDLFQETFGYPLYIKNSEGKMILNYTELLTDYIVTSCCNKDSINSNRPPFISYQDGKYIFDPLGSPFGNMQSWSSQKNFFEYKTKDSKIPVNCDVTEVCNDESNLTKEDLKHRLETIMKNGDSPTLGMCPKGVGHNSTGGAMTVPFYSQETGASYNMGGGHWISITEVTDDGVVVDSWGERCLITYDDLLNNSCFNIYETKFRSGE